MLFDWFSSWMGHFVAKNGRTLSAKETTVVLLDKRPTAESKSFDSTRAPRSSRDGGPMQGVRGQRREYIDPCKFSTRIICLRDAGGTARTKIAGKPPSQRSRQQRLQGSFLRDCVTTDGNRVHICQHLS